MNGEFRIRKARTEDVNAIFKIEESSFDDAWSKKLITSVLENEFAHNYVAENEKLDLVGYIFISEILGDVSVDNIAVDKNYRGIGISKLLMDKLIDLYGNNPITLEVRTDNIEAVNLYKRYGFAESGLRKDYYGLGIDAIIMWRR
ncbi:ribosomal protein S18-alanine N-acetyltransferase [Peptoniphilus sp. oral taxon 386]|uniref:ribosomal protein S18-alanine N-acetyltransferase n=1 Tax=Peptoniphilus sp. oral taxon 386 TaxID=652713 RepID=UPI00031155F5|nr:ribosomal protein S18-alanine N-acetyltransferase [Peptoniphilus sp. oral taxon 386]